MTMSAHINKEAVAWLRARLHLAEAFAQALVAVQAGNDLGVPIKDAGSARMYRFFRFGDGYIAVFEVDNAARKVMVVSCRRVSDAPASG